MTADWSAIEADLDAQGWAILSALLPQQSCLELAQLFDHGELFRSKVVMARHGYGSGVYQYFAYPLPEPVAGLRQQFYPPLAMIANRWSRRLGGAGDFPDRHDSYLARCRQSGQSKPTPLLLRYDKGDFNCLHQDLYGQQMFPMQMAVLLSQPGDDFSGGEFILTEQRPRRQSRPMVVPLRQGDAVIFPVSQRPLASGRATMRHGVSAVTGGRRHMLGVIFHDAA